MASGITLANRSYHPEKNTRSELTVSLHNTQKLDDDFGRGADQDLPFAPPFSINDVVLLLVVNSQKCIGAGNGRTRQSFCVTRIRPGKPTGILRETNQNGYANHARSMVKGGGCNLKEGAVSIQGAQSECRAMESASRDRDFGQRTSDCASPIAR